MTLPTWMRRALFATAVMNVGGAVLFLPPARGLRALAGPPMGEHPLYLVMVRRVVLLFGLGYLWTALLGRGDRLFITIATAGKLGFFTLLLGLWAAGELPFRAPLTGAADLVFGLLFAGWLYDTRAGAVTEMPLLARTAQHRR